MATIPLPALHLNPPAEQPNVLDQYARLQQLANMQQNAPLQRQALQQSVQEGQLEIQQKQQQLQDSQTLRSISTDPSLIQKDVNGKPTGYDFEGYFNKAAQSGVSPQTLAGLQKSMSDGTLAQANASKAQREIASTVNGQAYDHLEGLRGATDPAQRQQLWSSAVQFAQQNAQILKINPAQFPQEAPDDKELSAIEAALGMHAQQLADAGKIAERNKNAQQAAEAAAGTAQKQAETNFYAQNGGAPGVPAEVQQQADWLKKNPGKGPADFLKWKLQNTPSAMIMGNQFAPGDPGLDLAAENYRLTGQMPAGMARSPGSTKAIIDRAAALDQQAGGAGIAANKGILQANTDSLKKLQTNFDQVSAFESTAQKNIDLLQQAAQKIPDLGTRMANVPVRMILNSAVGTPEMASFKTALNTAQTEAAKVLNSSNASGVLSDSARHELQQLVDGNMTYPAMVASLNTLRQDMNNRHVSYEQQIGDIQSRIKGSGSSSAAPVAAPNGLSVTAPNGKVYTFKDQASADAFKQKAGIQ